MSSTFIALPLTNGDAFLLRTKDKSGKSWNILVDSGKKYGKNTRELALILSQVSPKVEHVDIAICTHQDADHANGCLLYTSPSPRDRQKSRMPSSA